VTSIAESGRSAGPGLATRGLARRSLSWGRALLLAAALGLMALGTPLPWAWLWLAVPAVVASALLLSWRFGVAAIALVGLGAVGLLVLGTGQGQWVWWIPAAALTGAWMGLREEGGGPSAGERAWMLAPLLLVAAVLPWLAHYRDLVATADRWLVVRQAEDLDLLRQSGARHDWLEKAMIEGTSMWRTGLPVVIPTALFLWGSLLVAAGRGLAARLAEAMRWPRLSRASLRDWRLPDAALWAFIAGLAMLLSPWPAWRPTGWTLLVGAGLGYSVQGVAVAGGLFLARGVPVPVMVLTLVFLLFTLNLSFVLGAATLGVSDVWLDYRRLESVADGDANPGDH
jgi:hypothetical protein